MILSFDSSALFVQRSNSISSCSFLFLHYTAMQCSGGMVYQECGYVCHRGCYEDEYDQYRDCEHDCVEGCHCPEGTVLNNGDYCHELPFDQGAGTHPRTIYIETESWFCSFWATFVQFSLPPVRDPKTPASRVSLKCFAYSAHRNKIRICLKHDKTKCLL